MVNLRNKEPKNTMVENTTAAKADTNSYKVFFLSDEIAAHNVELIQLRNPCTGKAGRYICMPEQQKFYELLKFAEPMRSWFINDLVSVDGFIYMTTLVDPLFLVLPYLQEHSAQMYNPLNQILKDEEYVRIHELVNYISNEQLAMIGDQKGDKDLKAFKYNEEKTLNWLSFKCSKLLKALAANKIHVDAGAKSATFVKSEKLYNPEDTGDEFLEYAIGIISEYISKDLSDKLFAHNGIDVSKPQIKPAKAPANAKRKSAKEPDGVGDTKRIKKEDSEESPVQTAPPKPVEKKVSTKEKALAKAASGSKNIKSFFKLK